MNDIPAIAWIAIGMVIFVVVAMNAGMFLLLRNPSKFKLDRKAPRSSGSGKGMGNFVKVLRDPFAEERGQLQELSNLVQSLDDKQPSNTDDGK
jgi:hypothetical protein